MPGVFVFTQVGPVGPAQARRERARIGSRGQVLRRRVGAALGNGSTSATPKMTTITAISTRFATETVKIDQCRRVPG